MSIKQNGGVFGRNPTFNDVTIEGQLTFDGDIDINSDLKIDGDLEVTGATTLNGATLATGDLEVSAGGLSLDKSDNPAVTVKRGGTTIAMLGDTGSGNAGDLLLWNSSGGLTTAFTGRAVDSYINSGGGFAINNTTASGFKLRVGGTAKIENDLTVTGDVIIATSGNGIDFSATAGSGTSELLDDYEEGTWTPTYTTSGTDFDSVTYGIQTGSYVKIGELVTVFCAIRTDSLTIGSGTGNVRIGGLPFTVGSTADQWNNATAVRAGFVDATNFELVACFGTTAIPRDINNNQAALTDLDTGANDNHLTFTLSYRV